jgi:hypothetical protein
MSSQEQPLSMANIKHCGAHRHHRSGGHDFPADKEGANPVSEGAIAEKSPRNH